MCSLGEPDQQHVEIKKVFKRKKKSPSQINRDNPPQGPAAPTPADQDQPPSPSPASLAATPSDKTPTPASLCQNDSPMDSSIWQPSELDETGVGRYATVPLSPGIFREEPQTQDSSLSESPHPAVSREYSEDISCPPRLHQSSPGEEPGRQEESFELLTKATAGRTFVRLRNFIKKKNSSFTPNPRPRK